MRIARLKAALAVVVSAVALAACGGGGAQGKEPAGADAGVPQPGGTMTIVTYSEPRVLDPAMMLNNYSITAMFGNALFGTLVTPGKEPGSVTPGLAESFASGDGGATWVLKLRDGLKFSDGMPLDATAVQYNWQRTADPKLGSESQSAAAMIDTFAAEGQTLTVKLKSPDGHFPDAVMTTSLNWIASPKALQTGTAFNDKPVGAGPFILQQWVRNGQMTLKKNASYYKPGTPYLDGLVIKPIGDEEQRYNSVQSGGADAAVTATPQHFDRAEADGLAVYRFSASGGIRVTFNTRIAPFDDVRARTAVVKALDLEAVNQAVYEGKAEVPTSLFAKDSPFYDQAVTLTGHDKDGAQRLFDELASAGKPISFTITSYPSPSGVKAVQAMQAQLNTYRNVKVEVEVLDYPAALAKQAQKSFQMIPGGVGPFLDPDFALFSELHSKSAGNVSGITDPELDKALEAGRASSDPAERKQAYDTVARKFAELNPILLYVRANPGVIHSQKAHGFEMYNRGSLRVDGLWLSPSQ